MLDPSSKTKPGLRFSLSMFDKDVQRQRQQHHSLPGLPPKQQPNHMQRTRSLSLQLSWRKLFKSSMEIKLQILPPGIQGSTPTCSSECSTISSPGAVQGLSRGVSGADVVDVAVDVRSCCSCSCGGGKPSGHPQPEHDSTAQPGTSSTSPDASCTPACSSPAEPAPPLRQRTRSTILAACADRARKLRQHSVALLKPALRPKPPPAAHCQDAHKQTWLPIRGAKATRQRTASMQPLSLSSKPQPQKQRQRAASLFEATGRENIRVLLGPNAVCGSITRYKMLLLAEQVHEQHLQTVLDQPFEEVDWAGEPAWQEDFSVITSKYAQRVRQFLFWWGGALSHLRWREDEGAECGDSIAEEAAAQVAVVVAGEDGVGAVTAAAAAAAAAGKVRGAAGLATAQTM